MHNFNEPMHMMASTNGGGLKGKLLKKCEMGIVIVVGLGYGHSSYN